MSVPSGNSHRCERGGYTTPLPHRRIRSGAYVPLKGDRVEEDRAADGHNANQEGKMSGITVGELRRQLKVFPDDAEVRFGGGSPPVLDFYRLKGGGKPPPAPVTEVMIEFAQQVYRRRDGTPVIEDV